MHRGQLEEKQHLNVVDDLCRFILYEVVNVKGKYFYDAQELAMDPKYLGLREWDNSKHHVVSSSACREQGQYVFNVHFNDVL